MSNKMGVNGMFAIGFDGAAPVKTRTRNRHTEDYDDDGLVITMTLRKFFNAYKDYATFLNDGARAYISLTDDEGQEVFQFSLLESFNAPAEADVQFSYVIQAGHVSRNIRGAFGSISRDEAPILLESRTGKVYGVLHPSVTLGHKP